VPAGAVRQLDWPLAGWYEPVAHSVDEVAAVVPTYDPGGAARQPICPLAFW
jgi:hypothetical protein